MQRTTAFVVGAAILAVALVGAAFLFTHKPKPEPKSVGEEYAQQRHEAEVACLEGGGSWVPGEFGGTTCEHSEPTAAPATSGGTTSGGIQTVEKTPKQIVDETYSLAEQRQFCVAAISLGYYEARRMWKGPQAKAVFDELASRCV
jgi:hypothetical protein